MATAAELAKQLPGFLPSQLAPNGFLFDTELRPFRIISIETEVDGLASKFAETMYYCGLVPKPSVMPYGWHPGKRHKWPGFIKRDGSVTGGEFVQELLDLTKKEHADSLVASLNGLRVLERERVIKYNPNCGGHIHIDADGFGLFDLWRLNSVYGHIEDLIYRLAGSGKTYGHRTLFKGYDRANFGQGYANPVKKGPFINVLDCYGKLQTQPRMSGLNYTFYFSNAYYPCNCGKSTMQTNGEKVPAVTEELKAQALQFAGPGNRIDFDWFIQDKLAGQAKGVPDVKSCTCSKDKHTVEWRVWNSQGNPRILYAWVALMQAMFAYSWRPADIPAYTVVDHLEPLTYPMKSLEKADPKFINQAKEHAEWMFSELPLAPQEKDALAYAFMRSECKSWGAAFFKKLVNTPTKKPEYTDTYTAKKPLIRQINLEAPAEGAKVSPFEDEVFEDVDWEPRFEDEEAFGPLFPLPQQPAMWAANIVREDR